jgi:hypothetical protein
MAAKRLAVALLALQWVLCASAPTGDVPDLPKPPSRTDRAIEGWTVRVDDRLFAPPHDTLGARTIRLLESSSPGWH